MGWTIAEKILARNALAGRDMPGAILRAKLDHILINEASGPLAFGQFRQMVDGKQLSPARDELATRAANGTSR